VPFGSVVHIWPGCGIGVWEWKAEGGVARSHSHCLSCGGALTIRGTPGLPPQAVGSKFTRPAVDFVPPIAGVPQRGQFALLRDGESGNPQAVHFIVISFQAESLPIFLLNLTYNGYTVSYL